MNDLIKIKKYYGENMMHLCRELFPTILEQENLLFSLLDSNFAHSKFLYEDIIDNGIQNQFKEYIYSFTNVEKEDIKVTKTPKELLSEAGYVLYECNTEQDIQSFRKYYSLTEELCTFNGGRLNSCYVFFAIKKNVDNIKRKDFSIPHRQDEYGTSVISIQFSRGKINTLSIKNRYNHTVKNPDATFSNNLENIIPGLTRSFEKEYNLNINQNNSNSFEIPGYVKANDGKYYKYNHEIDNIYYCPYNVIIDKFNVKKYEMEKYLIIDYFILDLVNKKIYLYDKNEEDSFIDGLQSIKKIEIIKNNQLKTIKIMFTNNKEAYIEIDKYNTMLSYKNNNLIEVGSYFLMSVDKIKKIELPNVEKIGDDFLCYNYSLTELILPNIKMIGNFFLLNNRELIEIKLPNVKEVGNNFLFNNEILTQIDLPVVEIIGNSFLHNNESLTEIVLPKVEKIGDEFLFNNEILTQIDFPMVEKIGDDFLCYNEALTEINLPMVEKIGNYFLHNNELLTKINLPKVDKIGDSFLLNNKLLKEINFLNIKVVGNSFLYYNEWLIEIKLPNIEIIGDCFLKKNKFLKEINLPNVIGIGDFFLSSNKVIEKTKFPKLKIMGCKFLDNIPKTALDLKIKVKRIMANYYRR